MANVNFGGNELLKGSGVQIEYTPKQIEEYQKCMNDPVYFAKTYITIVNLDKGRMKFNMYDFQEKMITQFVENRFNICKLPRQVGKCLSGETKIKVRNKKTGKVEEISAKDFFDKSKKKLIK